MKSEMRHLGVGVKAVVASMPVSNDERKSFYFYLFLYGTVINVTF